MSFSKVFVTSIFVLTMLPGNLLKATPPQAIKSNPELAKDFDHYLSGDIKLSDFLAQYEFAKYPDRITELQKLTDEQANNLNEEKESNLLELQLSLQNQVDEQNSKLARKLYWGRGIGAVVGAAAGFGLVAVLSENIESLQGEENMVKLLNTVTVTTASSGALGAVGGDLLVSYYNPIVKNINVIKGSIKLITEQKSGDEIEKDYLSNNLSEAEVAQYLMADPKLFVYRLKEFTKSLQIDLDPSTKENHLKILRLRAAINSEVASHNTQIIQTNINRDRWVTAGSMVAGGALLTGLDLVIINAPVGIFDGPVGIGGYLIISVMGIGSTGGLVLGNFLVTPITKYSTAEDPLTAVTGFDK